MPVNIDDIKKLPNEEKLKIIDELWESIDQDLINEALESEEEQILRERLEDYEKGNVKFRPWDEVKKEIEEKLKQNRNAKK
ncbi:addiction module protein [Terrimonas alba]|uniref:addiction module protein n=1 Tax=Terrimonas alba TaxID=3349636 RepID=UPI0035F336CB